MSGSGRGRTYGFPAGGRCSVGCPCGDSNAFGIGAELGGTVLGLTVWAGAALGGTVVGRTGCPVPVSQTGSLYEPSGCTPSALAVSYMPLSSPERLICPCPEPDKEDWGWAATRACCPKLVNWAPPESKNACTASASVSNAVGIGAASGGALSPLPEVSGTAGIAEEGVPSNESAIVIAGLRNNGW